MHTVPSVEAVRGAVLPPQQQQVFDKAMATSRAPADLCPVSLRYLILTMPILSPEHLLTLTYEELIAWVEANPRRILPAEKI